MPNLVLRRRIGERIFIGEDVVVTVLQIGGTIVKLSVEAPESTGVFREEIAPLELCAKHPPKREGGK